MITTLEAKREEIKKRPKNIKNLLDLMRHHASMLEVYVYIEDLQKNILTWCEECTQNYCINQDENCAIMEISGVDWKK